MALCRYGDRGCDRAGDARAGYLYLLVNPGSPPGTVKVGRTNNHARRLAQYPKGSRFVDVFGPVDDCHEAEKHLITAMRSAFLSSDYGREYFVGAVDEAAPYFRWFCYELLQSVHMPWMRVPMDCGADGASG